MDEYEAAEEMNNLMKQKPKKRCVYAALIAVICKLFRIKASGEKDQ